MRAAVGLGLLAALTAAAETRLSGPSIGYVLDKDAGVVRRIAGIPGASSFDAPIILEGLRPLAVSSAARHALGVAEDGSVSLVRLASMERIALDGTAGAPDTAVFSSSGSAAILMWKDGNRIEILKGLPDKPAVSFEAQLPETPSISAVDDSGTHAIFTIRAEDVDVLYSADENGVNTLQKADHITAADFMRGTSDALFVDSAALYRVHDGNIDRLADAAGALGLFGTDKAVIIATSEGVSFLNVADLSSTTAQCGCTLSTLRALGTNVFGVTDAMNAPLWILDMNGSDARFFFVPQAGGSDE